MDITFYFLDGIPMTNGTGRPKRAPWLSPYITVRDVDKAIEFYKNFKKQMVLNPRISGLGVLFSGVILIMVGLIVQ